MNTPKQSSEALRLRDELDDILQGFDFWKNLKIGSGELTTIDEVFIRWVEADPDRT